MPEDIRKLALAHWVSQTLSRTPESISLTSIASDAGFRRYFRFDSPSALLAVDAPPQTEDTRQFVALARYLRDQNIKTPQIEAVDEAQGFLLIEDFGDSQLYSNLSANLKTQPQSQADRQAYSQAFKTLLSLQACGDQPALIPRYDQALLRRELEIFSEWFVGQLLGYNLSAPEQQMLQQVFAQLEASALSQPQGLVHRDFHSRNLMVCSDGDLGVIDFQGALWGAATYDLVSLLRDCYIRWPATQVRTWAAEYRQLAISAGLLPEVSEQEFMRWFDWMGLQRHIKVLGIFARLQLRDSKSGYLKDLPLVLRYTLEVAEQYSEFQAFTAWFKQNLLPLIQQQPWYSDYQTAGDTKEPA
jgi:N-acetylmuramate 1-kinase